MGIEKRAVVCKNINRVTPGPPGINSYIIEKQVSRAIIRTVGVALGYVVVTFAGDINRVVRASAACQKKQSENEDQRFHTCLQINISWAKDYKSQRGLMTEQETADDTHI